MIPVTGNILQQDFKIIQQPSTTFYLDIKNKRINGSVDGSEAVKQAVYCILNTERFEWLIYSWNYGAELNLLFGKPSGLVKTKIKKRIREALLQDDRIQNVDHFEFELKEKSLHVTFTVNSIYGDLRIEKEVNA
ncbi:DUF2634 domain-containing protein [Clostridium boliviensis]|uniref:DUF2634 domain-containing protein n=1 Tax=Clostridium boliviensis TaxID=318465 RepID=A0ABU4GR07_9CLOT|nr:DUF2634 domain-containing protein [Clostridium boliviensis]MDW2799363.1 DUF2634 domain-containing protein [Clostridium boliviensis]